MRCFYKLSTSIGDTAEVQMIDDVNTYQTFGLDQMSYIYDVSVIFDQDTTLSHAEGFKVGIQLDQQSTVNHIPAAMTYTTLNSSKTFISMFSYAESQKAYLSLTKDFNLDYLLEKEKENKTLHDALTNVIKTNTVDAHILTTI